MDTATLLKKVRKIEIKTRGLSDQVFSGSYHSAFKGRGMSFSEVRKYTYGDDVRNIDWNVTARFNEPYIKVFEEEREITAMLLIDVSKSSFFGTQHQLKKEIITEIAAVLSFSAIQNNDKVGVLFFSDQVETFIPPKKGKSHILRIIRELIELKPQHKKTNISNALEYFNNIANRRSIVFILSDFIDTSYEDALRHIKKRHDVLGIHLYDIREKILPRMGLAKFVDAESEETYWVNTNKDSVRETYEELFIERERIARSTFLKTGADFLSLSTEDNYIAGLKNAFKQREKKR